MLNILKTYNTISFRGIRFFSKLQMDSPNISPWATINPFSINGQNPGICKNLIQGQWVSTKKTAHIVDPLKGDNFLVQPDTSIEECQQFIHSIAQCPKSGLHNPLKNVERYNKYGQISAKAAFFLGQPEVMDYFVKAIQRVCPKSYAQAYGEVNVTRIFLQNFSGDQVRYLAKGFTAPGDHLGQQSTGYRWPYGPVSIVAPFNFPLEIPLLQLMGALFMGNKVLLKSATTTAMVMEQFLRFLHWCGMPTTDVDYVYCRGAQLGEILTKSPIRLLQFTGSSDVAEKLTIDLHGKIKIEDAGFDWKILGPDVSNVEYVAWQCDQDAYAASGQKCSAESILFAHSNWMKSNLLTLMKEQASKRSIADLTVASVLSHTTEEILDHMNKLLAIPGSRLLWGGKELSGHTIPKCYGAVEPTAVFVPLTEIMKPEFFPLVTREIFGPFQVVTEYDDKTLPIVLEACERMTNHLTAAVVSNDVLFLNHVLGNTINGTQYAGIRARTTGAPQNHWFGPSGEPRGAGIGTIEAIRLVWSCHREIITDYGPVNPDWTIPKPT